jgi:hypothetical protein
VEYGSDDQVASDAEGGSEIASEVEEGSVYEYDHGRQVAGSDDEGVDQESGAEAIDSENGSVDAEQAASVHSSGEHGEVDYHGHNEYPAGDPDGSGNGEWHGLTATATTTMPQGSTAPTASNMTVSFLRRIAATAERTPISFSSMNHRTRTGMPRVSHKDTMKTRLGMEMAMLKHV